MPHGRFSLYGGRVVVDMDDVAHTYDVTRDGVSLGKRASVTKILGAVDLGKSSALAWWASAMACDHLRKFGTKGEFPSEDLLEEARRAHDNIKEDAADTGKVIHSWLEAHVLAKQTFGEDPPMPSDPLACNAILSYLKREDEHGISYEDNERIVYSMEHDFIGTLDHTRLHRVDGVLSLGDYKSAKDLRLSFRLQLAAYAKALMEEHPDKVIGKRFVYLLGKEDGELRVVDLCYEGMTDAESLEFDYKAFLAAKTLWEWGEVAKKNQPKKSRKKKEAA